MSTLNSPSQVIIDNIDIIYQIREILHQIQFNIDFHHIHKPSEDDFDTATAEEKLLFKVHNLALNFYRTKNIHIPSRFPIMFPAQKICIMYNKRLVVTNIEEFPQETERKGIREEYFLERMNIHSNALANVDQYAIGRVFQKNKHKKCIYTKIMHKQLNTMEVNHRWKLGEATRPLCKSSKEDWLHVLKCSAPAPKSPHELCLETFETQLTRYRTYPPLADFIYEAMENLSDQPEEPLIANANYSLIFHQAYNQQSNIGWQYFFRGFISKYWKAIQHRYYV